MESPQVSDKNVSINEDLASIKSITEKTTNPTRSIVFFSQIIIIFTVVLAAIINLSLKNPQHTDLWISMISTALGILLPAPKLKYLKTSKLSKTNTA